MAAPMNVSVCFRFSSFFIKSQVRGIRTNVPLCTLLRHQHFVGIPATKALGSVRPTIAPRAKPSWVIDRIPAIRLYGSDGSRRKVQPMKAAFSWKSFAFSAGILSIFFGGAVYYRNQKRQEMDKIRRRSLGKAAIGGKFSLVDSTGKPFTSDDLKGKWVLLYFGFSHCPDICPEEMEKMVLVVDRLEKEGTQIVPLFITVDPERDSPEVVGKYVREFSPKLIGLTGTKEQIDEATKAYRVYYSAGPRDGDNDYIVDHTIIMYLINPDGEFVDYYGQLKSDEQVANGVSLSIVKYNNLKKKSWLG